MTGGRQTGKTSLLARAFPNHHYVTLDVPAVAEAAELSGEAFLAQHRPPLIVDEIQYAPALLRYIKADIDQHRDERGRFLITGSQKFSLMEGVTESLAGRASIVELHSLSAREIERSTGGEIGRDALPSCMFTGGFPEVIASGLDPTRFYGDYLATYLERDVRSVLQVRSLRDFDRFLRLCATRTSQLLSYSSLAADLGISPNTVKGWVSVLEASGVIRLLEPYHSNLGKRIVKTPKLYFLDTGLACFLAGIRSPEDLRQSALLGPIFESFVLGQIVRSAANSAQHLDLYFYRDHHGHEVDFLIPRGERLELIECKWAELPSGDQPGFREISRLVSANRIAARRIVTPVRGARRLADGVEVVDSIDFGA
ncbi:MAG: ATP-binding protein [Deltaproteobacteria bacterium]|nr:ATP-binding protein [Deltaproteobacteria bacterium]